MTTELQQCEVYIFIEDVDDAHHTLAENLLGICKCSEESPLIECDSIISMASATTDCVIVFTHADTIGMGDIDRICRYLNNYPGVTGAVPIVWERSEADEVYDLLAQMDRLDRDRGDHHE